MISCSDRPMSSRPPDSIFFGASFLVTSCFGGVASILLTKRLSCRIALSEKCRPDPHVRCVQRFFGNIKFT